MSVQLYLTESHSLHTLQKSNNLTQKTTTRRTRRTHGPKKILYTNAKRLNELSKMNQLPPLRFNKHGNLSEQGHLGIEILPSVLRQ